MKHFSEISTITHDIILISNDPAKSIRFIEYESLSVSLINT